MTRGRLTILVGAFAACIAARPIVSLWTRYAIDAPPTATSIAAWRYDFGAVRWVTIWHDASLPASTMQIGYSFDGVGLVLQLALTTLVALVGWASVRWMVRLAAVPRPRDGCGDLAREAASAERCAAGRDAADEEGDEAGDEEGRPTRISVRFWGPLLTGLAFLSIASVLSAVDSLDRTTIPTIARAADPDAPVWRGYNLDQRLGGHFIWLWGGLLFCGSSMLLIWMYRRQPKHPPDRAARLLERLMP